MADTYTGRTLRELVRIVASRFAGMVLIFAMVVVATALASWYAPNWYRSEVELLARPTVMTNPLENRYGSMRDEITLFVATQRQIILSDYVLATALMRLEGKAPPALPLRKVGGGAAAAASGPSGADESARQWEAAVEQWSAEVDKYLSTHQEQIRRARKRVEVVTPGGPDATFSQTFTIRVDWPEERKIAGELGKDSKELAAQRARDLAAHVKDAYLLRSTYLEGRRTRQAAAFLTQQALVVVSENREAAARALEEFTRSELKGDLLNVINMITTGSGGGIETGIATLVREFQGQINKLDEQVAGSDALLSAIKDQLAKDPAEIAVPDAVAEANLGIRVLQQRMVDLKLQYNSLAPKFTPDYNEVKNVKAELAAAQNDLRQELSRQAVRIKQNIDVLTARRKSLNDIVAKNRQSMDDLAIKAVRYQRLQNDMETSQRIFEEEKKRAMNAATAKLLAEEPVLVSVLDEPSRPDPADPRMPILWLNLLVAAAAGLILAFTYAFLSDHFDHAIKGIDDAERYLGVPVLASVPKLGRHMVRIT